MVANKGFSKNKPNKIKIDLTDGKSATFYKYNNVIYNMDSTKKLCINIANKSSRYKEYKDLIDAAIQDLSNPNYEDGKWIFNGKYGWLPAPISFGELTGISVFDDSVMENVSLNTPMQIVSSFTINLKK